MTKPRFKDHVIALTVGILMNPIVLLIVFFVDSPTSNVWLHGKPLLERTPFAYTFFWSSIFLPGNPPSFDLVLWVAITSNTILYYFLTYFILNNLRKKHV